MKILKQKILFLLFFSQRYTPAKSFRKEGKYLSYNFLYNFLPCFLPTSIRKATTELVEQGAIEKIIRNRQALFRITQYGEKQCRKYLVNFFKQNLVQREWFLAISKECRNPRQVRHKLQNLGFVKLARGVWIKPGRKEFTRELEDLTGKAFFLSTQRLEFVDERQLVGSLWGLDKYFKKTNDFISRSKKLLKTVSDRNVLTSKEKKTISALFESFFIIIKNTIGLPKNLLPNDWPLPEAATIFTKILKKME
jgi:DNA-binding transcriptional regulator PaaX